MVTKANNQLTHLLIYVYTFIKICIHFATIFIRPTTLLYTLSNIHLSIYSSFHTFYFQTIIHRLFYHPPTSTSIFASSRFITCCPISNHCHKTQESHVCLRYPHWLIDFVSEIKTACHTPKSLTEFVFTRNEKHKNGSISLPPTF